MKMGSELSVVRMRAAPALWRSRSWAPELPATQIPVLTASTTYQYQVRAYQQRRQFSLFEYRQATTHAANSTGSAFEL